MRALDLKLLRGLWRQRGHVLAIVLVAMCGTASFVTMRGAYEAILNARDDYYVANRFADVFVTAKRAPASVVAALAAIEGVSIAEDRVTWPVTLEAPRLDEPAIARIVSLPAAGESLLNVVHLKAGRMPDAARDNEILMSSAFAAANGLAPGDTIPAIVNGRWRRLAIAGIALSPEYVNEALEFNLFPDPRRFGIFWMPRPALEAAVDMKGAFNSVTFRLAPGAVEAKVIAAVDRVLAPYGGAGAFGRKEQFSHQFLEDEINQDRVTGAVVPAVFLAVAAFLVHNVLLRLIALERAQIGVLKAFGYTNWEIGRHYASLALAAMLIGTTAGIALGAWLGEGLAALYRDFFHFPALVFSISGQTLVGVAVLAVVTALAGSIPAVLRVVRLAPAEAMRAAAPARYRRTWLERIGLAPLVPLVMRMVLRNLERRPLRTVLSVAGIALAVALLVIGRYSIDAINEVVRLQFQVAMHDDVALYFNEPRGRDVLADVRALPGVLAAEPFRYIAVRLRAEHRSRRVAIHAQEPDAALRRVIDSRAQPVRIAEEGLVLSKKLAEILQLRPGDTVSVELLEGRRTVRDLPVTGIVDEYIGLQSYMSLAAAARLLGEAPTLSGVYARVDAAAAKTLYKRLREMPAVAMLGVREAVIASFFDTIARNLRMMTFVLVGFACVIAAGMVYNGARIALSEHALELASLRVLGFTQGEAGLILVGEQALLTLGAIPIGWALGYAFSGVIAHLLSGEVYRLPLVISRETWIFSGAIVLLAAMASAAMVLARLRRLDLVEALKNRE